MLASADKSGPSLLASPFCITQDLFGDVIAREHVLYIELIKRPHSEFPVLANRVKTLQKQRTVSHKIHGKKGVFNQL